MPGFAPLEGDTSADVLIIGGGMAGLLCAWYLKNSGVDALLIESDRICSGVTRNTTAKITSQHGLIYQKLLQEFDADTANLYWHANEEALNRYSSLAKTIDCGFVHKDNYIFAADSPEKLELEMKALEQSRIPAIFTQNLDLPVPAVGAVKFRNQAQFDPLQFAAGIARGLNIRERTTAREFVGNTVMTDRGRITASKIIVATHFPMLNKHGGYFLKLYQQRAYVMALEGAPLPEGMYLEDGGMSISFRSYGNDLLLGGGGHRTGKPGKGWEPLEALAKEVYPQAKERCRWAAQDCMSLDGMPYIGTYSKRTPDLHVATGFGKWGMTSSMVSAMILSDLVQDRDNVYRELFSPQRRVLRPQLAVNAAESTWNLLKPTKPRCPHLGCALQWNPQEHSWDCPCHGSRFAESGELLDNPATDGLNWEKGARD